MRDGGGGGVVCHLMEAALQAHLTHAGLEATDSSGAAEGALGGRGPAPDLVSAPLAVLGAALTSQPSLSIEGMMARSLALETPLTMRVLFALQLALADGSSPTVRHLVIPHPLGALSVIAACVT